MSTLLLVNPAAGGGRAARLANEVAAAAREAWGEVVVSETQAPGHGTEQVRDAVRQGAKRVLVLGGDGTLHEAANGVLSSAVPELPPIGVIPGGTGNDYAKIAGTVGLSAVAAVDRLARGRIRYLDVGIAWGEYFLNAIGIGFDAEVARYMNANKHAGGIAGYLQAVVSVLGNYRPFRAEVQADGNSFTDGLMLLEVGIGNVVGGGFRLTPDAQPDDGLFDVCAIRQVSIPGLLIRLPLTIPGWHTRLRVVRSFRTATLTVIGLDGPLVAQLDGEVRTREGRMEIRVEAARLPVMVIR
jgi:YegS/Rv2252/BmrU family lipid kinase